MVQVKSRLALAGLTLLAGCASQPMGPTIAVMPAPNKPFAAFQEDQAVCTQYANQQVTGGAGQANTQQLGTAVIGTALGAGLGAAIGGGRGAAIGAGSGALAGTVVGAGPAQQTQLSLQQHYNIVYSQCMYAKGNQVPGYQSAVAPPPPPGAPPPPPPVR
ncbi:MAG TPA: YMGG-like glycine zipper-containing protein [Stellaceae bacterium]|nr:YMGG-like glycine zipper-containing protein [Stellaceae bacterium]